MICFPLQKDVANDKYQNMKGQENDTHNLKLEKGKKKQFNKDNTFPDYMHAC